MCNVPYTMKTLFGACLLTVCTVGCALDTSDTSTAESEISAEHQALIASTRASIATRGVTAVPAAPHVRKALVRLGRALAHDKLLSGNHDVSCMTCHAAAFGSDDDRHLALGVTGVGSGGHRTGNFVKGEECRNAPPLFNMHVMQK